MHTPTGMMFERQRNGMTDALKLSFRANPKNCDTNDIGALSLVLSWRVFGGASEFGIQSTLAITSPDKQG